MATRRMLSADEARRVYDRIGARQDSQGFYEDAALADLIDHADFGAARAVVEFGCGTGRLAARLLAEHLPAAANYAGFDLSPTMVELARGRLAAFGDRARVALTAGAAELPLAAGGADRFVSTYVLDLLADDAVAAVLAEAHRLLAPGGRLCLAGLTFGATAAARAISALWRAVHAVRPAWVGGCRPIAVAGRLDPERWQLDHRRVVTAWAISSEVVVAVRRGPPAVRNPIRGRDT